MSGKSLSEIHSLFLSFRLKLFLSLLFCSAAVVGQAPLMLPVEFMVENGSLDGTLVTVKNNNVTVFTTEGKSNMRLKLELNASYLISFSKQGYITKSISVSTKVPPERASQSFEPYRIGVKLFRQYEGVNIVVYSQPVAHIHYNPEIDDFDYDVDYTKSILSMLKAAEEELEVRAAEERRTQSGNMHAEQWRVDSTMQQQALNSGRMNDSKIKNSAPDNIHKESSERDPLVHNANVNGLNKPLEEAPPIPVRDGDKDPANSIGKTANVEKPEAIYKSEGSESQPSSDVILSEDPSTTVSGMEGKEPASESAVTHSGEEAAPHGASFASEEKRAADAALMAYGSQTYLFEEEPMRYITTITVVNGVKSTEYRKVEYKWGGIYYFINKTFSISPHVFQAATGRL